MPVPFAFGLPPKPDEQNESLLDKPCNGLLYKSPASFIIRADSQVRCRGSKYRSTHDFPLVYYITLLNDQYMAVLKSASASGGVLETTFSTIHSWLTMQLYGAKEIPPENRYTKGLRKRHAPLPSKSGIHREWYERKLDTNQLLWSYCCRGDDE